MYVTEITKLPVDYPETNLDISDRATQVIRTARRFTSYYRDGIFEVGHLFSLAHGRFFDLNVLRPTAYGVRNTQTKEIVGVLLLGLLNDIQDLEGGDDKEHETDYKEMTHINPSHQWKAYQPILVWVDPAARGRNLGIKMYECAILRDGLMVVSGETQTARSAAIWNNLVKHPGMVAWAFDLRSPERAYEVRATKGKEPKSPFIKMYQSQPEDKSLFNQQTAGHWQRIAVIKKP